jgi:hypothetical protein
MTQVSQITRAMTPDTAAKRAKLRATSSKMLISFMDMRQGPSFCSIRGFTDAL